MFLHALIERSRVLNVGLRLLKLNSNLVISLLLHWERNKGEKWPFLNILLWSNILHASLIYLFFIVTSSLSLFLITFHQRKFNSIWDFYGILWDSMGLEWVPESHFRLSWGPKAEKRGELTLFCRFRNSDKIGILRALDSITYIHIWCKTQSGNNQNRFNFSFKTFLNVFQC